MYCSKIKIWSIVGSTRDTQNWSVAKNSVIYFFFFKKKKRSTDTIQNAKISKLSILKESIWKVNFSFHNSLTVWKSLLSVNKWFCNKCADKKVVVNKFKTLLVI